MNHILGKQWWDKDIPEIDRHSYVTEFVNGLKDCQGYVDKDLLKHLQLYAGRNYSMDEHGNVTPAGAMDDIGINVIKSVIDTKVAKIASQKPRANILTDGGRWKQRLKAKKLEKFIMGLFDEQKYYEKAEMALKDSLWKGDGYLKVYVENGDIKYDRVFPGSIIVDEAAAMSCMPRSMAQVENVPLESLVAAFPDKKMQILTEAQLHYSPAHGRKTNMCRVYEIWHLPDQNGDNGRHCICVDGVTLLDEDWKHDFFPFVIMRPCRLPVGFYGNGDAENMAPKQEEIDFIMGRIQTSMHTNATAWIIKHTSDKLPNQHITNKIATILEYSGNVPPQVVVSPALHQQVFDHVKWLNQICYEESGVSQFSATSTKPAGIESGVALQKVLDVESTRHGPAQAMYERAVVDCAKISIALAKEHFKGSYKVKWEADRFVETIDWSEVNIPEDEFRIKIWPVNLLPDTPAGRLDAVEKMLQAGMIDPQVGMMLLDFPDVEAFQSLNLATIKNILWLVDQVVYEDNYVKPRIYHNLELGIKYMQMAVARAETEGAPDKVIERCLDWMAEAADLMAQPPPAPPPLGGDPMMDPAMQGGAPTMATPMEGMPPMEPGMLPPPPMDPSMGGGM